MFRFLLLVSLSTIPASVLSYSGGPPKEVCANLKPMHLFPERKTSIPYRLAGDNVAYSNQSIPITLSGDGGFLGFVIQARSGDKPIGEFQIIDKNSQILNCGGLNTLTHNKIDRQFPVKQIQTIWKPPGDFKGKVTFVATVAQDGKTFWVKKNLKNINIL